MAVRRSLDAGLKELGLSPDDRQRDRLVMFLELLAKWNRTWNLTAITEPTQMVALHLLDSLSVLPLLAGRRVLDVGSGAGLPGIPLAVANPERDFVLLDSNGKRTRFMTHAVGRLGLGNVTVTRSRVEDYHDESGFDTVLSRAFASLADFVRLSGHLCRPGGSLVAMKGRNLPGEAADLPYGWALRESRPLRVPGVAGERHAIVLGRESGTLDR